MKTLIDRLLQHAEQAPERCAVASETIDCSYAELAQRVMDQAEHLSELGVTDDSVIGIDCADDVLHLILCLAAVHLGATSCTAPSFESQQAVEQTLDSAGATRIIRKDMALDGLSSPPHQSPTTQAGRRPAGATLLFSTSGTTGEPKVVAHSDSNLVAQAHRHILSPEERFACLASMEHNFAKRHRLYCVARGATNVFLKPAPTPFVKACQSLKVTTLHVSAFQAQELLAITNIGELSGMRLKLGGSHVSAGLRQSLRDRITSDLYCGYGTTETGAIAFTDPEDPNAEESVGRALPGIEIRITDNNREPVETGERGEIAIQCEGMFHGYENRPELTAARLIDGWFYTGDVGYLDERDRLRLCGRSDDMFVFNSLNIYPQDIEALLCRHPMVIDAAVLPKPSAVHGDIPVALVVFDDSHSPDLAALKKYARDQAGLRSPRQFTIVEEIPRNAAGKIQRAKAHALFRKAEDR